MTKQNPISLGFSFLGLQSMRNMWGILNNSNNNGNNHETSL